MDEFEIYRTGKQAQPVAVYFAVYDRIITTGPVLLSISFLLLQYNYILWCMNYIFKFTFDIIIIQYVVT